MRTVVIMVVLAASLVGAARADAAVQVRTPPKDAFCLDRIPLGVRLRAPGPRLYSITVYGPRGRRVFRRSGVARTAWRLFRFRPIDDPRIRYGVTRYRVVYRAAGQVPKTFVMRVLCGE